MPRADEIQQTGEIDGPLYQKLAAALEVDPLLTTICTGPSVLSSGVSTLT